MNKPAHDSPTKASGEYRHRVNQAFGRRVERPSVTEYSDTARVDVVGECDHPVPLTLVT